MKSLFLAVALLSQSAFAQSYPIAKKIPMVETRFGQTIEDSYKWMENASDPDLWSWIDEQKALTASTLDVVLQDKLAARVLEVRKTQEEQNKVTASLPVVKTAFAPGLEEDLNSMGRAKGLIVWESSQSRLKNTEPKAESQTYKAETRTVHNGDLTQVVVTQKSDNKVKDILLVKFYQFIAWADDNSFYYVSDLDERIGGGRTALFRHTVGDMQSEDKILLAGKTPSSSMTVHKIGDRFYVEVDGAVGSLQLHTGLMSNRYSFNGNIVEITDSPEVEVTIRSFERADKGELVRLRLRDGSKRVLLGEQSFVMEKSKRLTDKAILVWGLQDATHVVGILNDEGLLTVLDSLKDGTVTAVSFTNNILALTHETFSQPRKLYTYDLATAELKVVASQTWDVELESEKIAYTATNGQSASLFVIKKKGATLSAKTPLILYGYGGFKISLTPTFNIYESIPWVERGGAIAVVTLPGSLDYGLSWYKHAQVENRINAWDSFALAAKELIKRGWTSSETIGMMGASNGGVLVSGTLQRHPELFKAAVPLVGVHDLLNFTLFTAGKYWTEDYGNSFTKRDFEAMRPLSPYHNLERRNYPATLVMTAEFDDRVVPMHSYKYLAKMQEMQTGSAPVLLYNKEWGGHARASGSPRESSRFVAAFYTFFAQQLGQ